MMKRFSSVVGLVALAATVSVAGCAAGTDGDPNEDVTAYAAALPDGEAATILSLVNYPGSDVDTLNRVVGLDVRAARQIVALRSGPDGISPSADDVPFTALTKVDAIPYVTAAALKKLNAYALAHPAPAGESVEGIALLGWQSQAIVWGVNNADVARLNSFLDRRAAQGLADHRPFATVADMGAVPYVGATAIAALNAQAQGWWGAMRGEGPDAGTFDGVVFDELTAMTALTIVNAATSTQLLGHGVSSTAAKDVIGARAYTSLAQVAAVSGVGTATMQALHDYAKSGQWTAGTSCVDQFDDAVGPSLADLLFLSESDRPLDLVSFPGAGSVVPTATSVTALVKAVAGSRVYTRSVDDYFIDLEPSGVGAGPQAAELVEAAVRMQLTDIVYIAIQPPAGTYDDSSVDVYLLGRTSCGDLVGLHAISIET